MRYARGDWVLAGLSATSVVLLLGTTAVLLGLIVREGAGHVSVEFLTSEPASDLTGGGIFPAIVGTVICLIGLAVSFSLPEPGDSIED
jgi:phosphate transport system permease protein